jgi:hypothetical protein
MLVTQVMALDVFYVIGDLNLTYITCHNSLGHLDLFSCH